MWIARFLSALLTVAVLFTVASCSAPNDSDAEKAVTAAVTEKLGPDVQVQTEEDESDTGDRFVLVVTFQSPDTEDQASSQLNEVARQVWITYPHELIRLEIYGHYAASSQSWEFILSPGELEKMFGPTPSDDGRWDKVRTAVIVLAVSVGLIAATALLVTVVSRRRLRRSAKREPSQEAEPDAATNSAGTTSQDRSATRGRPPGSGTDSGPPATPDTENAHQPRDMLTPSAAQRADTNRLPPEVRRHGRTEAAPRYQQAIEYLRAFEKLSRLAPRRARGPELDQLIAQRTRTQAGQVRRLRELRNAIAHGETFSERLVKKGLVEIAELQRKAAKPRR